MEEGLTEDVSRALSCWVGRSAGRPVGPDPLLLAVPALLAAFFPRFPPSRAFPPLYLLLLRLSAVDVASFCSSA